MSITEKIAEYTAKIEELEKLLITDSKILNIEVGNAAQPRLHSESHSESHPESRRRDEVSAIVNSNGLWRGFTYKLGGFTIRAMHDTFMVFNSNVIITHNSFTLPKHNINTNIARYTSTLQYHIQVGDRNCSINTRFGAGLKFDRWSATAYSTVMHHCKNIDSIYDSDREAKKKVFKRSAFDIVSRLGEDKSNVWYHKDIIASRNTIFVAGNILELSRADAHLHYKSSEIEVLYYNKGDKLVAEFCIEGIWFRAGAEMFDVINA